MAGAGCKMRAKMRGTVLKALSASSGQSGRHILTIGIAGPSGVGKSTLAQKLATALGSPIVPICLDWFLIAKKGAETWETPDTLNFSELKSHLQGLCKKMSETNSVPRRIHIGPDSKDVIQSGFAGQLIKADVVPIIVEGFLLFQDVKLCNMFDVQLWMEADCETCMLRRRSRNKKRTADSKAEFDKWYRRDVWPNFELYQGMQLANASKALMLDGTASMDEILGKSLGHCRALLKEVQKHSLSSVALASVVHTDAGAPEKDCKRVKFPAPPSTAPSLRLRFRPAPRKAVTDESCTPTKILPASRLRFRPAPKKAVSGKRLTPAPPNTAPPTRLLAPRKASGEEESEVWEIWGVDEKPSFIKKPPAVGSVARAVSQEPPAVGSVARAGKRLASALRRSAQASTDSAKRKPAPPKSRPPPRLLAQSVAPNSDVSAEVSDKTAKHIPAPPTGRPPPHLLASSGASDDVICSEDSEETVRRIPAAPTSRPPARLLARSSASDHLVYLEASEDTARLTPDQYEVSHEASEDTARLRPTPPHSRPPLRLLTQSSVQGGAESVIESQRRLVRGLVQQARAGNSGYSGGAPATSTPSRTESVIENQRRLLEQARAGNSGYSGGVPVTSTPSRTEAEAIAIVEAAMVEVEATMAEAAMDAATEEGGAHLTPSTSRKEPKRTRIPPPAAGNFMNLLGSDSMALWRRRACRGGTSSQVTESEEHLTGGPQKRLRTDSSISSFS